jgi:hypothetical protein
MALVATQLTVSDHEDCAEEVPHPHAQSCGSCECSVDMPPLSQFVHRKRVQAHDHSDESESFDDSNSSDTSEEEDHQNEDLQNLNSHELAHTFENEVHR